jgi:hypothetical protein
VIAKIAQTLQTIIDIEKSRLPVHRLISNPFVAKESETRRIGEVFRSVQLAVGAASGDWQLSVV